ncbi:hypothetical protein [Agrobacterium rosae]|uniref:Uncharacterized protein n=1 Tax=Agrobacterium rosae TaxID=1972867 RepID=A0A1R3U6G4_9HYPH|nr:hypothetical protein [Agrobacterium rosae]SCX36056.1 hypothetical protein DSM25559_5300 [Agrobacterium rosae]
MADLSDNKWNEQDNLNTSPAPDGLPPGSPPSAVYGVIRNGRGAQKRDFNRSNSILTSSGTGAAYVLTYDVGPAGFVKGEIFRFFPHADNTGAATIKINGLTTKPLVQSSGAALIVGQIKAGQSIEISYDGTAYRVLSDVTNNPVFSGNVYVGPTGSFVGGDGNIAFTQTMSTRGANLGEALDRKANLANPNFSGVVGLPGVSANEFKMGTADGASYSQYNLAMKGWWGLGMQDHTNAVNGYYDFRLGKWDTKGGTCKNGTEYVLPNGGMYNVNVLGSAGGIRDTGSAGGNLMRFNWNGQPGQPSWVWGGVNGADMYVYNPSNFTVANSAQLGGIAASEYLTKSTVFQSANQTYTTNALGSIAHGLGRKPNWYIAEMVCTTASNGWSVGDTFDMASQLQPWTNTGAFGIHIWSTATTINWKIASSGIGIINKSNGNADVALSANWQLRFRAGF